MKTQILLLGSLLVLCQNLNANVLPPVLDYYPQCEFTVIDKITARKKSLTGQSLYEVMPAINESLQRQAADRKAQAIIIIEGKQGQIKSTVGKLATEYWFKAELIGDCDNLNENNKRPTPFNSDGLKSANAFKITLEMPATTYRFPEVKYLERPQVSSKEVSLEQGVYGVRLGSSVASVISRLGDPSVYINLMADEVVLGYGRRHWFHFQQEKLVRISTDTQLLSIDTLNLIPMLEFYDDSEWKVNGKLGYLADVEKMKKALGYIHNLDSDEKLRLANDSSELIMDFSYRSDNWEEKKEFQLQGFTLQNKNYQPGTLAGLNSQAQRHQSISELYNSLANADSGEVTRERIDKLLGLPLARIDLKATHQLLVYSPYLVLDVDAGYLSKIQYLEHTFSQPVNQAIQLNPWQLASANLGDNRKSVRNKIADIAYESDDTIELESDNFQTILYFSNETDSGELTSAEVIVF